MIIDVLKGIKRIAQQNKPKETLVYQNYSYRNWWPADPAEEWFTRFMLHYFPDNRTPVRFYSVFGPGFRFYDGFKGVRVFYSGEDLEPHIEHEGLTRRESVLTYWKYRTMVYGNYCTDRVDLSLGFAHREDEKYYRFPEWIPFTFRPEADYDEVRETINQINGARAKNGARNAVILASHDDYGTRDRICRDLEQVMPITYAGKWRNNSNELKESYKDQKLPYVSNFRFHICPENVDAPDYCTEKLFDAFRSGTIPVYFGAAGRPEPDVINRDAVIFWNFDKDNEENLREVLRLNTDEAYYERFMAQPKLLPQSADYVWDIICGLKDRMEQLL